MRFKHFFYITIIVLMIVLLPVFAFALRELIEVYLFKVDHLTRAYFSSLIMSPNTYKTFFTVVDPPNAISWIILFTTVFSMAADMLGGVKLQSRFSQTDNYGSHGTARWQTKSEIIKNYFNSNKEGWFLGGLKKDYFRFGGNYAYLGEGPLNKQVNVVGPPSSKKTTGFVMPSLLHIPYIYNNLEEHADIIVTDPKSELYRETANYFRKMGYDIKVLDFINLKYGDSLNVVDFITTEKELIEVTDGYVRGVEAALGSQSKDKFWIEQEAQALGGLLGAVMQIKPKEKRTFAEALKVLTDELTGRDGAIDMKKARAYFEINNVSGAALQLWKNFLMFSKTENTAGNILGGLAGKLKLFAIDGVQAITNTTTVDISMLGAKKDRPMILYIFMPDTDRTFSPIINTQITMIFNQLYKTAHKYGNKLANPVYFILEEAANIGYIPGLQEKLGTMRGRRIYPMLIWQSLAQMKDRYPTGWEDILSMCDNHVYLGVNDEFTAKYVSNSLGATTIRVQGISRKNEGLFGANTTSESYNYQSRNLMLPDELMKMDVDEFILRQRGRNPAKLKKVQYMYWDESKRICQPSSLDDLPLLEIQSDTEDKLDKIAKIESNITHNKEIHYEYVQDDDMKIDFSKLKNLGNEFSLDR